MGASAEGRGRGRSGSQTGRRRRGQCDGSPAAVASTAAGVPAVAVPHRPGRDNGAMSSPLVHRVLPHAAHAVPAPFRSLAVRSDEALHAADARSPYDRVHLLQTRFLDARACAGLAAAGYARVNVAEFSDIDYATTTPAELAASAHGVDDLAGHIADALHATGVLGAERAAYRASVETRIDYLAARGAGFHNDVARHWTRCLFWILALDVHEVEFVMPHAGLRLALAPGDLLVFDQTMAHGLCRPADRGQAVAASFEGGARDRQIFLTGELLLGDARWAALGAPWLPVAWHAERAALDLMVAEFDERSGVVKRVRALADCMKAATCHVDEPRR